MAELGGETNSSDGTRVRRGSVSEELAPPSCDMSKGGQGHPPEVNRQREPLSPRIHPLIRGIWTCGTAFVPKIAAVERMSERSGDILTITIILYNMRLWSIKESLDHRRLAGCNGNETGSVQQFETHRLYFTQRRAMHGTQQTNGRAVRR